MSLLFFSRRVGFSIILADFFPVRRQERGGYSKLVDVVVCRQKRQNVSFGRISVVSRRLSKNVSPRTNGFNFSAAQFFLIRGFLRHFFASSVASVLLTHLVSRRGECFGDATLVVLLSCGSWHQALTPSSFQYRLLTTSKIKNPAQCDAGKF